MATGLNCQCTIASIVFKAVGELSWRCATNCNPPKFHNLELSINEIPAVAGLPCKAFADKRQIRDARRLFHLAS